METEKSLKITSTYLKLITHILEQDNINFLKYLMAEGIDLTLISNDEQPVSYRGFSRAIVALQKDYPEYPVGLIVGARMHVTTHGDVSLAALSSQTVEKGMQSIAKYLRTREPFFIIEISSLIDCLQMNVVILDSKKQLHTSFIETAMLVVQNAIEHLSGLKSNDSIIQFDYPAPEYSDQYPRYFTSTDIEFDCNHNRITIPRSLAEMPCVMANRDINLIAEMECRQQLSTIKKTLLTLDSIIIKMQQPNKSIPALDEIAQSYSVSSRTLIRFLRRHNTTYREIRDDIKRDLALEYICQQKLSVNKTACLLGYSETASFRRAFKRWYGCNPTAYNPSTEVENPYQ